jgi:cell wall-associated NlpC family hydrolase
MTELDKRLHAFRPDLADIRLKGRVEAPAYTEGERRVLTAPIAGLHREPRFDAMQLTQVLMGEPMRVFEAREGWAWVQLETDGYVGYVSEDMLWQEGKPATHRVAVPSTFMFQAPSIKTQPVVTLPMNAALAVTGGDEKFASLSNGQFVFRRHLREQGSYEADFVEVAERFLHVPYLWGGKSSVGLDCSGLVQLALEASGIACPRDSDMQENALGNPLPKDDLGSLRRGDLVFWDGHVGIMTDADHLLHANGHFMQVTREPLREAVARIAAAYGNITSIRRL